MAILKLQSREISGIVELIAKRPVTRALAAVVVQ